MIVVKPKRADEKPARMLQIRRVGAFIGHNEGRITIEREKGYMLSLGEESPYISEHLLNFFREKRDAYNDTLRAILNLSGYKNYDCFIKKVGKDKVTTLVDIGHEKKWATKATFGILLAGLGNGKVETDLDMWTGTQPICKLYDWADVQKRGAVGNIGQAKSSANGESVKPGLGIGFGYGSADIGALELPTIVQAPMFTFTSDDSFYFHLLTEKNEQNYMVNKIAGLRFAELEFRKAENRNMLEERGIDADAFMRDMKNKREEFMYKGNDFDFIVASLYRGINVKWLEIDGIALEAPVMNSVNLQKEHNYSFKADGFRAHLERGDESVTLDIAPKYGLVMAMFAEAVRLDAKIQEKPREKGDEDVQRYIA